MRIDILELAWAAGLYDGEESTSQSNSNGRISCSITQNHPEVLERFRRAVGNIGSINGPHIREGKNPQWAYSASGFHNCQAIIAMLWEFLGTVKREQAAYRLETCHKEKRRHPGYCRRDHPRSGDNLTAHGQCRTCMRENDRKRVRVRKVVPRPQRVYVLKTECKHGHPRTPENRNKWDQCVPCVQRNNKAAWERKKAAK